MSAVSDTLLAVSAADDDGNNDDAKAGVAYWYVLNMSRLCVDGLSGCYDDTPPMLLIICRQ